MSTGSTTSSPNPQSSWLIFQNKPTIVAGIAALAIFIIWQIACVIMGASWTCVMRCAYSTIGGSILTYIFVLRKLSGQAAFGSGFSLLTVTFSLILPLVFILIDVVDRSWNKKAPGQLAAVAQNLNAPTFAQPIEISGTYKPLEMVREVSIPSQGMWKWGFVGIIPPSSPTKTEISPLISGSGGPPSYFLVDGDALLQKPQSLDVLRAYQWNGRTRTTSVYPLKNLPFQDKIGSASDVNYVSLYLQSSSSNRQKVQLTMEDAPGVSQWIIDLSDTATLTITKQTPWSYIWIVPIYDEEYLAQFDGLCIPPKGLSKEEYVEYYTLSLTKLGKPVAEAKEIALKGYEAFELKMKGTTLPFDKIPFLATYVQKNGFQPKTLTKWEKLTPKDVSEKTTYTIGFNDGGGRPLYIRPSRVLVGISGMSN